MYWTTITEIMDFYSFNFEASRIDWTVSFSKLYRNDYFIRRFSNVFIAGYTVDKSRYFSLSLIGLSRYYLWYFLITYMWGLLYRDNVKTLPGVTQNYLSIMYHVTSGNLLHVFILRNFMWGLLYRDNAKTLPGVTPNHQTNIFYISIDHVSRHVR